MRKVIVDVKELQRKPAKKAARQAEMEANKAKNEAGKAWKEAGKAEGRQR